MSRIWVCTLQHPSKLIYRNLLGVKFARRQNRHCIFLCCGSALFWCRSTCGSLPKFYICWKIGKNYFMHSTANLQCFSFLANGKGVMILSILDCILKISGKSKNAWNWFWPGSGKMKRVRPNGRSRRQLKQAKLLRKCSAHYSHSTNFINAKLIYLFRNLKYSP